MRSFKHLLAVLACVSWPLALWSALPAQAADSATAAAAPSPASAPVQLSPQLQYQWIGRWDAARLNRLLTDQIPAFTGVKQSYTPARNAVHLYRLTSSPP